MKKSLYLMLTGLFALSLAACGGGGGGGGYAGAGGGGGGGVIDKGPLSPFAGGATPVRQANSLSDAIGVGPAAGLTATSTTPLYVNAMYEHNVAYQMAQGFGYQPYKLEVNGNKLVITGLGYTVAELNPQDFTVLDNNIVGATFSGSGWGIGNRVLLLGGKAAGLEHTNFGAWMQRGPGTQTNGEVINIDGYSLSAYSPFIMESTNAEKKAPATGAGAFTGTVMANASDSTRREYLVGQATLNVTGASSLAFTFPNFYTMTTGVNINGSGGITQNGNFTLSDPAKNTTGINLYADAATQSVAGQFYGKAADANATEAVGTFSYLNSSQRGVKGSFGVKQ